MKTISRRNFLKDLAAGTAALPFAIRQSLGDLTWARPNVLFVLCDQWRFSAFSHGEVPDALVQTPNLDAFIQEGARWRKAFATNPVCSPERATLVTGRYPHQTGMITNNLMIPPGNRCLAEVFREAGYATHYIGKVHFDGEGRIDNALGGNVPRGWRRRGFTTFEGSNRGHFYYRDSKMHYYDNDGIERRPQDEIDPDIYEPAFQTDFAIRFMQENRHRPFLCYLSWGPPHTPYRELPASYIRHTITAADRRPNVPDGNPGASGLEGYLGHCEALDEQFGRLMGALKDLGLEKNTLVVFTSDHGDMHYSQNMEYKGKPEEESLHIPLFMRWPKRIVPGQIPDTLIGGVDVMPTLLSLCGLPVPGTCSGIDKSAAVLGGSPPSVDSIYCEGAMTGSAWRCVVTDRYKLVVNNADPLELSSVNKFYDLREDPYELNNLVDDPAHADLKQQLFDRLVQWRDETGDTFPVKPPAALKMYT